MDGAARAQAACGHAMSSHRGRNGACTEAPDPSSRRRPESREVFAAAVELATAGAGAFRRTARRYSICAADADDAYQRSLEILLTKAPTADRSELRPWLHTVIKHEALAAAPPARAHRRARGHRRRTSRSPRPSADPEETAGDRERVRHTAEALGTLKPNELQCMVLKALGYSYDEISAAHRIQLDQGEPLADRGTPAVLRVLRRDRVGRTLRALPAAAVRGLRRPRERRRRSARCARTCRRARRAARRCAPTARRRRGSPSWCRRRSSCPCWSGPSLWSRFTDWLSGGGGERAGALGAKLQQGAEMVSAQKAAAVVASTAALAGGGAAVHEQVRALPEREPACARRTAGRAGRGAEASPRRCPRRPAHPCGRAAAGP